MPNALRKTINIELTPALYAQLKNSLMIKAFPVCAVFVLMQ